MTTEERVRAEAAERGVAVETDNGGGVTLLSPEGQRFGPQLHVLVNAPWNGDTQAKVWRAVLDDLRQAALEDCPADCPCWETEEGE